MTKSLKWSLYSIKAFAFVINLYFTGFGVTQCDRRSCMEFILHRAYCCVVRRTELRGIYIILGLVLRSPKDEASLFFCTGFIVEQSEGWSSVEFILNRAFCCVA